MVIFMVIFYLQGGKLLMNLVSGYRYVAVKIKKKRKRKEKVKTG